MGAMLFQILVPVLIIPGLTICFCTMLLTCVRALLLHWVGGVKAEYIKLPTVNTKIPLSNTPWIPPYYDGDHLDA